MKSTSGIACYFRGALIAWQSKRQSVITTSTAAAEYTAIDDAIKLTKSYSFFNWIMENKRDIPTIFNDNQSALAISKSDATTKASRHLLLRMAHVKEHSKDLAFVDSDSNLGDMLTKYSIPRYKFIQLFQPGLYQRDKSIWMKSKDNYENEDDSEEVEDDAAMCSVHWAYAHVPCY